MKRLWVVFSMVAVFTIARDARAQQACVDPDVIPNPVFLSFGESQIPLIKALGKLLRETENITLVWRAAGSCPNLESLYENEGSYNYRRQKINRLNRLLILINI